MAGPQDRSVDVDRRRSSPVAALVQIVLLAVTVFAAAVPSVVLGAWLHGDYDRFIWILHQRGPCNYIGGGPVQVWFSVGWWLLAFVCGLLVIASTSWHRPTRRTLLAGSGAGLLLIAVLVTISLGAPEFFARSIVGCPPPP